jgi:tetratricopeptide (TPR) repeat protein
MNRLDNRSWQRRVWARIALDRRQRSRWRPATDSDNVSPRSGNMTDEPRRTLVVRLARSSRALRSWLYRLVRLSIVVCLCVVVIEQRADLTDFVGEADCAAAVRDKRQDAVQVCRFQYQRTQDPATGVRLAAALNASGDHAAATQLVIGLLDTPARPDALYLRGLLAREDDDNELALTALQEARKLHRLEQRHKELARDDGVLAMVRVARSEYAEALQLIDECITEAQLTCNTDLQCYCHLAAADALIAVGYGPAADRELDLAKALTHGDERRRDLEYQYASLEQDSGRHGKAIAKFRKALQYHTHSQDPLWTVKTELNLAYSLAEYGQPNEAQQHLDNATLLDADHKKKSARTLVAAQIAYRKYDLARAATLTDQYFELFGADGADDRDDRIDAAVLGARIALDSNDLPRAEQWARRGVEQVEQVRGRQGVLELRPWVLAKWRAPYELRFTARARGQNIEAAVMAFDEWQGRTVQDSLVTPRPPASLGYRGIAAQITRLGAWLRVASQAAFAKPPDREAVLRTMQSIDLLALIVANDEVWRLVASHGAPRLSRIKPLAEIQELVDQFRGHPTDMKLASDLGALLLPDDVFRVTREVLHVLVDGRLQGLPVAALRRGAVPLIALRPIVRVLRLPETPCARAARPGRATVIAVDDAEIPNALIEAQEVAGLLHTTSQTGAAATKAAVFAAASDAVLHVAAHGEMGIDGAALVLADGEVSALEIPVRNIAPSLAVLTACDSAASEDPELAGSLAAGFLGAGSQHVVATLRSISDRGGLEIAKRFYRAGGVADPPRALAAVQAELATTANTDWPNFVVFGPEICTEDALGRR